MEAESTRTVMAALREVIASKGLFCSLYSDRAGHFFVTPKRGERVDAGRPTQVGRALQELGIRMIPAYSPQARGRMERSYGTWQGRLPQELRLRGIHDLERANEFLRCEYRAEFNRKFAVPAAQKGSAFVRSKRSDLDWIFSVQHERTVNQDNTISVENRVFQLEKTRWRNTLAGQTVMVHEHLDGRLSIRYGPHVIAQYASDQLPPQAPKRRGTRRLCAGSGMTNKASFCGTQATPSPENPSRLNPAGGLCPAWTEPPASHLVPHMPNEAKPKTGHLTCYLIRTS